MMYRVSHDFSAPNNDGMLQRVSYRVDMAIFQIEKKKKDRSDGAWKIPSPDCRDARRKSERKKVRKIKSNTLGVNLIFSTIRTNNVE